MRRAWRFAIARPADLEGLTQALHFWFEGQGDSRQFDRPSVVSSLRNNQVVRTLVGTGGFSPDWGLIFLIVPSVLALAVTALFFRRRKLTDVGEAVNR